MSFCSSLNLQNRPDIFSTFLNGKFPFQSEQAINTSVLSVPEAGSSSIPIRLLSPPKQKRRIAKGIHLDAGQHLGC